MPRMYNSGLAVDVWYETADAGSSTFDLCTDCADRHEGEPLPKRCVPYNAGEPSGTLEVTESPLWDDYDLEGYECAVCRCSLSTENY